MTLEEELTELFMHFNPQENWGVSVAEAVSIAADGLEDSLWHNTIEQLANSTCCVFEGLAYGRLGFGSQFSYGSGEYDLEEGLIDIYRKTEYAQRVPEYHDLKDKTLLTLSNGEVIPINQHLLKSVK